MTQTAKRAMMVSSVATIVVVAALAFSGHWRSSQPELDAGVLQFVRSAAALPLLKVSAVYPIGDLKPALLKRGDIVRASAWNTKLAAAGTGKWATIAATELSRSECRYLVMKVAAARKSAVIPGPAHLSVRDADGNAAISPSDPDAPGTCATDDSSVQIVVPA